MQSTNQLNITLKNNTRPPAGCGFLKQPFIRFIFPLFAFREKDRKILGTNTRCFCSLFDYTFGNFHSSFLSLFMGVIILGGIILGIFTATEAAAVAVMYGFFLSVGLYKEIKMSQIPEILWKSAVISGVVMLVVGISYGFGWVMGRDQIPVKLANFMISIPGGKWMFLLAVNILLLVMGMFFDASLSVVILVPILFPVAVKLGIHPVHFGIFVIMNLGIGFTTPPFGLSLFIASGIAKVPMSSVIRPIIPYILTMIGFLLVVTYVPWFSMILPRIFMGY
jgi:C4-dicarboxylate transporter DctM subunit